MTTQELIFDTPLYTKVNLSEGNFLDDLTSYRFRIDGYNSLRGADSTFCLEDRIDPSHVPTRFIKTLRFVCQRYDDILHVMIFVDRERGFIEKVGQYPSMADIHIAQIKQYKKVLDENYIKDLTRSIGLAANGIGTGSFVYLRRVFEHLVSEIAEEAIQNSEVDRTQFEASKMDNKLKLLSNHLPEVVIENKSLYGILSAGIHNLSEEECLKYFSVVREVIELILDEREFARQKEEKKKKAKNMLGAIAGEINKK